MLVALPRQLDSYFEQQDQANLEARTEAMATLVGNQIIMVTTLAGNPFPVLQEQPLRASDAVYRALEQTGFVRNLTPSVALADVTVTIAESPDGGPTPVYTLAVPLAEDAGELGQTREDLRATSVFPVPDVYYTENPGCGTHPAGVGDAVAARSRSGSRP